MKTEGFWWKRDRPLQQGSITPVIESRSRRREVRPGGAVLWRDDVGELVRGRLEAFDDEDGASCSSEAGRVYLPLSALLVERELPCPEGCRMKGEHKHTKIVRAFRRQRREGGF